MANFLSTEGSCREAATCLSNNNLLASICLSLSSMSDNNSILSPSRTSMASLTRLEIRIYIRLIDTCRRNSDGLSMEIILISRSVSNSISIPLVSRKKSLTSILVFLDILPSQEILIMSAPERYEPIIRSPSPVIWSQQSITATFFVVDACS